MPLPGVTIDENRIVSSTGALDLKRVPKHLLVVGAGYIGLEMGTVWRRLGAKVTVVEFLDRVTPGMDGEVSKEFEKILKKQGMVFKLGTKVTGVDTSGEAVKVTVEPAKGGAAETIECDTVLVAIGRRPYTEGLGLEQVGVRLDNRGRVETDGHWRTNVAGRLGDRRRDRGADARPQGRGGGLRRRRDAGRPEAATSTTTSSRAWSTPAPEVASIGKTEEQLKEAGTAYKVGKFPFRGQQPRALGRRSPTASSRSWPTPPPTGCWARISSAPRPAR